MITLVSCFFRFLNFEFENLKLSVWIDLFELICFT
jgi:hypothetical protein